MAWVRGTSMNHTLYYKSMTTLPVVAPLHLDRDRPLLDLTVLGPDGTATQRFLVDTGGGGLLLTESLAHQVGIPLNRVEIIEEWGLQLEAVKIPVITLAGHALDLDGPTFVIREGGEQGSGNMISGRLLSRNRVIFDFPQRRFALDTTGPAPRGVRLPTPIHHQTKFARIEIRVEEQAHGMLLDTGAGCTMISPRLLQRWREEHPEWDYVHGAQGTARKGRQDLDEGAVMVHVPWISIGPFCVEDVWMVARPVGGRFEEFSARMMAGPAVGALGGNVLKLFRVEIDYATGVTYLERGNEVGC